MLKPSFGGLGGQNIKSQDDFPFVTTNLTRQLFTLLKLTQKQW
jgi:hypothetical protein